MFLNIGKHSKFTFNDALHWQNIKVKHNSLNSFVYTVYSSVIHNDYCVIDVGLHVELNLVSKYSATVPSDPSQIAKLIYESNQLLGIYIHKMQIRFC